MAENLVIVESPAKAKTIKKYLGKDFEVLASYGHVRDLVPKEGAVDTEHGFAMQYRVIERNEKHVDAISRALSKAKALYLATDPDREGEAISWHLHELLKERGDLKGKEVHRVVFYEITKNAIRAAIAAPRGLSMDLVNAQQARRALDYLVGFNLSPLLWKKVRQGLSAGRVQSPALRMICEREEEIDAFMPQEYWTIDASGEHSADRFPAEADRVPRHARSSSSASPTSTTRARRSRRWQRRVPARTDGPHDRSQAAPPQSGPAVHDLDAAAGSRAQARLLRAADHAPRAAALRRRGHRRRRRRPDHLHAYRLGVAGRRGRDRDPRHHRAGSTASEGLAEEIRVFKTKSKNAQEAHEAIRPTSAAITPADIEGKIDADQFKLYALIWKRAVACQMAHAVFDTVAVDMQAGPGASAAERHLLRANGSTLVKPGYIAVYQEGRDDAAEDDTDHVLPAMQEGDKVLLVEP